MTSGFGTVIAAMATTFFSLSFIFSTTAQEVLGSCIFLFVKHPLDVGDRVDILDKPYIVEHISLLSTVFRNVNDDRLTQVPNNILNSQWVDNLSRANAMHERLVVSVAFGTTFNHISMLREEMEKFVRDKENARDFHPDIDIEVVGLGAMDKLDLRVDIRHKSNWANESVRSQRRSKFMCALVLALRRIPVPAPGAEEAEETKGDGEKGDDPESNFLLIDKLNSQSSASRKSDAVGVSPEGQGQGQSTGIDTGLSTGSVPRRGPSGYSNNTGLSPDDVENFRTPAASPDKQLSKNSSMAVSRGQSMGRRKEGVTSQTESGNPSVPIIPEPVPPPRRPSAQEAYTGAGYDQTQTYPPPQSQQPPYPQPAYPQTYQGYVQQPYAPRPTPAPGHGYEDQPSELPSAMEPYEYPSPITQSPGRQSIDRRPVSRDTQKSRRSPHEEIER